MKEENKNTLLIGCMREIPDPRASYNQRHQFLDIIIIAVTAVLAGMDTWNEITGWAVSKKNGWRHSLNCLAASHPIIR